MKNIRIALDFDDCLDQLDVQEYAKELINDGIDVYICTARTLYNDTIWNKDVFDMASLLGISHNKIIITDGTLKSHFLKGFLWLLDDHYTNIEDLSKNSDCCPILYVKWNNWKEKCNKLISDEKEKN